tara:strand:+ start:386 stop:535 length:150 start_codon:yes stop_codon:yes gene_type:complete
MKKLNREKEMSGLRGAEIEDCDRKLIKLNLKADKCKTRKKAIKILSKLR